MQRVRFPISPAILCLTVVSGCLWAPEGGEGPPAASSGRPATRCDATQAIVYSGNAPPLAAFAGPPEAVLRRVADALEDPLRGERDGSTPWAVRWNTSLGVLSLALDGSQAIHYRASRLWPGLDLDQAPRVIDDYLAELGESGKIGWMNHTSFDEARQELSLRMDQTFEGGHMNATIQVTTHDYYGRETLATVGPVHALARARATLHADEAERLANSYATCMGAAGTRPGAFRGFAVRNESLAYIVEPEGIAATQGGPHGCPPAWTAYVDAVTGALHELAPHICL